MAFAASVAWRVWTTGNAANGGGFDPTSGTPGTDFSKQTGPQVTYTDLVIDGTTNTKCTSAAFPFDSTHVGNIINITSGTGFTVQRVQVLSVAANVATCDKSLGTLSSTGGNGKLGGALATIDAPIALVVPGNTVFVKATATYTITANITFSTSGSSGLPISWIGYTTTDLDNGQVTVTTATNALSMMTGNGNFQRFFNFDVNPNSTTTSRSFNQGGTQIIFKNCKARNFTTAGFNMTGNQVVLIDCVATLGGSAATAGFINAGNGNTYSYCRATANACPGFSDTTASTTAISVYDSCISDNNTGASTDGFIKSSSSGMVFRNCISYKNARDALRMSAAASVDSISVRGCIFVSDTGLNGVNSTTTNWSAQPYWQDFDYNAYYQVSGGTARTNVPTGPHDVTLSGDPFTNGASNDFSLNNTSGAGAACRAVSFPGVLQSGGTGYRDIGPLQHQDSGGSAGMLFIPNMEGT